MNPRCLHFFRTISTQAIRIAVCGLALLAVTQVAHAQFQPWSGSSIVRDPEWQKSFLGSYGFLSGAEPEIKSQEIEILREVWGMLAEKYGFGKAKPSPES